jgi:hypothetical protein
MIGYNWNIDSGSDGDTIAIYSNFVSGSRKLFIISQSQDCFDWSKLFLAGVPQTTSWSITSLSFSKNCCFFEYVQLCKDVYFLHNQPR